MILVCAKTSDLNQKFDLNDFRDPNHFNARDFHQD